ncbi:MAG: hypothetical protein IJV88_00005, partial [Ruminococcus sp.]|nr:hypothetical protein [Ruminococcus sp.]
MTHRRRLAGKRFLSALLSVLMLLSLMSVATGYVSAADTDATKTVYFAPNGYCKSLLVVYSWEGDLFDEGDWTALSAVDGVEGLYCAEIPAEDTGVVFASRNIPVFSWDAVVYQTEKMTIPAGSNRLTLTSETTSVWDYYSTQPDSGVDTPTQPDEEITGDRTLYFAPNEDWMNIQGTAYHEFAVHAYSADDAEGTWVLMTLAEGEYGAYPTVWSAQLPAAYNIVEFSRVQLTSSQGEFAVYGTTDAQAVPAQENLFTQDGEDETTGQWSLYIPSATEAPQPTTATPTVTTPSQEPTEDSGNVTDPVETKKIYFTPNDSWSQAVTDNSGAFSAYAWNSETGEGSWVWLTDAEDSVYVADVPVDADSIYFGASFSVTPEDVWFSTEQLTIPDDSDYFTLDETGESGQWSSYGVTDPVEPAVTYYSVAFVNADGTLLTLQTVAEGKAATAPEAPTMAADAQYTYTFKEWDTAFDSVTENLIIRAVYDKI